MTSSATNMQSHLRNPFNGIDALATALPPIQYKTYAETDSGNTSNTSSTSAASTNTCASSLDATQKNPSTVGATGTDFTSAVEPANKPGKLLFTKKAITRSRPSSNQLSALVASQSSASRTSSTSSTSSTASVTSFRETFQDAPSPSAVVLPSSLQIGAQFPFQSTNHAASRNPSPIQESRIPAQEPASAAPAPAAYTTPRQRSEKAKRFTSESVLPTLCVRVPPNVKLLGIHRTASSIDTTKLKLQVSAGQQKPCETVSLPTSPTTRESMLPPSLATRNGSSTSLTSVASGSMVQPPRQLRSPKTPLYRPSVLRRTMTTDKLSALASETQSLPGSPDSYTSAASITAPPSRKHWKPDHSRRVCAACNDVFSFFTRRHHCRKCGDVFCEKDSSYVVRLDQQCAYHVLGTKSRACRKCHDGWVDFLERTDVVLGSSAAAEDVLDTADVYLSDSEESVDSSARPTLSRMNSGVSYTPAEVNASNATLTAIPPHMEPTLSQSVAGSVPANWSWSTF